MSLTPEQFDYTLAELVNPDGCALCRGEFDEYHHTSYKPERILPVCDSCHTKIHSKEGYWDDLKPNRQRSDVRLNYENVLERMDRKKREVEAKCGPGNHVFVLYCLHCKTSPAHLNHYGLLGDNNDFYGEEASFVDGAVEFLK